MWNLKYKFVKKFCDQDDQELSYREDYLGYKVSCDHCKKSELSWWIIIKSYIRFRKIRDKKFKRSLDFWNAVGLIQERKKIEFKLTPGIIENSIKEKNRNYKKQEKRKVVYKEIDDKEFDPDMLLGD